ncbi:hypothetical protein I862_05705 [endosymbiont of Acanthamoeba sp. UWC8]|uniref:hypothetical protein n=1 Tax=endosymbiont of Acanthamoeba sp. UWC8 TaxID=86106 RepID=UPI0004D1F3F5|nr:hypothetical protein [endosymbiont of Acanthamoeba sp. UWC8]AIF81695.1 hypothetical protein I862_05705 [endosymbiont of Acanthamoeba sp. UWC8]
MPRPKQVVYDTEKPIKDIPSTIKQKAKDGANAVKESLRDVKDSIKETAEEIKKSPAETGKDFKSGIKKVGEDIKKIGEDNVEDLKITGKDTIEVIKNLKDSAKETIKNKLEPAKKIADNWTSDKEERTEDCFKLISDNGITLCNPYNNNTKIDSYSAIGSIGRYNPLTEKDTLDYCIKAFEKKDAVDCSKISEFLSNLPINEITSFINGQAQCLNGYKDIIKIPTSVEAFYSIGKTIGTSDNILGDCQVIIRDINPKEGDKIDFSKFSSKTFSDLRFYDGTMNKLPLKAIDIYEPEATPKCLVGIYNYDANTIPELTSDMFVIAPAPTPMPTIHIHTEL